MVIAVTYDNELIFPHFGRSPYLAIYLIGENKQIVRKSIVSLEGNGHMGIALILHDLDVDVLICGGIGGGAQMALAEAGIKLFGGVFGDADSAVDALLKGELEYNPNVMCSHHHHEEGHSCGSHSCGHHSCH